MSPKGHRDRLTAEEEFEAKLNMTKAFWETAKSYVQIGAAALALPLVSRQAFLGKTAAEKGLSGLTMRWLLYAAWGCFLLTIFFGLVYQWLAIRRVWDQFHSRFRTPENVSQPGYRRTWWVPHFDNLNLAGVWGGMTCKFSVGSNSLSDLCDRTDSSLVVILETAFRRKRGTAGRECRCGCS